MDMSLDERIAASKSAGRSGPRTRSAGGGVRKNAPRGPRGGPRGGRRAPDNRRNKESYAFGSDSPFDARQEWAHDKWEDSDEDMDAGLQAQNSRNSPAYDTYDRSRGRSQRGYKVLISNLHEAIGTDDLRDVFSGPGGLRDVRIHWDRDRSTGRAHVIYETWEQASEAVADFNGQLAKGQMIRVQHDDDTRGIRNNGPARSKLPLEARITRPSRSPSPEGRRSTTTKAPPRNIDRYIPDYVPGDRDGSRSRDRRTRPQPREPRESRPRGGRQPRPRKTKEELDAEMEDYFTQPEAKSPATDAPAANPTTADTMEVDKML